MAETMRRIDLGGGASREAEALGLATIVIETGTGREIETAIGTVIEIATVIEVAIATGVGTATVTVTVTASALETETAIAIGTGTVIGTGLETLVANAEIGPGAAAETTIIENAAVAVAVGVRNPILDKKPPSFIGESLLSRLEVIHPRVSTVQTVVHAVVGSVKKSVAWRLLDACHNTGRKRGGEESRIRLPIRSGGFSNAARARWTIVENLLRYDNPGIARGTARDGR